MAKKNNKPTKKPVKKVVQFEDLMAKLQHPKTPKGIRFCPASCDYEVTWKSEGISHYDCLHWSVPTVLLRMLADHIDSARAHAAAPPHTLMC